VTSAILGCINVAVNHPQSGDLVADENWIARRIDLLARTELFRVASARLW